MSEPVAITGIGVACALGTSQETVMRRLLDGESGIGDVSLFDATPYPVRRAGEVGAIPPPRGEPLSPDADRAEALLAHVGQGALDQSGWSPDERTGLILGTTVGGLISACAFLDHWARRGKDTAPLQLIAQNFPAHQQAHVARRFGMQGPLLGVNNACASGADAIGAAMQLLRRGRADVVIAGGYDPLAEFTFAGFSSLNLVTKTDCRPFAPDRDGFQLGEGAALFPPPASSTSALKPLSLSCCTLRAGRASRATGTRSTAPAEALATCAVRPTVPSRPSRTPSTPAAAQVRRIAPRLPASVTRSTSTSKPSSFSAAWLQIFSTSA